MGDNQKSLRLILKKQENLGKDQNPENIELVVNFSTRPDKVEKLIQLTINNDKTQDMAKTIYFQDIFQFTFDIQGSIDVKSNYSDLEYNVNDFKSDAIVPIKFQILLQNFKMSKKIDGVKVYLFYLLEVYLINNLIHSAMLTPENR